MTRSRSTANGRSVTSTFRSDVGDANESPLVSRRLQLLREWSHGNLKTRKQYKEEGGTEVFAGGARTRGGDGPGASGRARFAMESDRVDRGEVRLLGRNAAQLGAAGRA